jgi:Zn-dependent protease
LKAVFRKSARGEQMRFVFLALALFALSWFLLSIEWVHALILGGGVAGAFVLGRVAVRSWISSIVVDDRGIESRRRGESLRMAWDDVMKVELATARLAMRGGVAEVRCAVIADSRGRRIGFSDLSLVGGRYVGLSRDDPLPIHDVGEPEILLSIVARRTRDERFLPAADALADGQQEGIPGERPQRKVDVAGLGAVATKVGGKIAKAVTGVFKTVKPGFAIVSGAVYALIFDWKFAIGLMVMLLFHEYGHVHAMRKSGLPVRGIYFIPLLGAAAVSDGTWKTRSQQAYIALNGPLWGLYLTAPLFAAALIFGESAPVLPAMAAWWSLINLFNLLPINPLDGGRVLNAVSHSLGSWIGMSVSGAAFAAGIVLAFVLEVHLFVIVGLFGLIEFVAEVQASRAMARLRMAELDASVPAEALLRLRMLVRPVFRSEDEIRLQSHELARLRRTLDLARIVPMSRGRTVLWGLFYIALVAAFAAVIALSADNPAAGLALEILR